MWLSVVHQINLSDVLYKSFPSSSHILRSALLLISNCSDSIIREVMLYTNSLRSLRLYLVPDNRKRQAKAVVRLKELWL